MNSEQALEKYKSAIKKLEKETGHTLLPTPQAYIEDGITKYTAKNVIVELKKDGETDKVQ